MLETSVNSALLRSRVYGLLRRVFTDEVDEAFLDWCGEQQEGGLWSGLGMSFADVVAAADPEATLERLAVDFCQLFVTSGAEGSPHESLHTGAQAAKGGQLLLLRDSAAAVRKLYREAGMELAEAGHLLPDALAVELEFMERLSAQEAVAAEENRPDQVTRLRDLQRRMLGEHVGRWVPAYAQRLAGEATTAFYRTMLNLLADFVEWDTRQELRGGTRPSGGSQEVECEQPRRT